MNEQSITRSLARYTLLGNVALLFYLTVDAVFPVINWTELSWFCALATVPLASLKVASEYLFASSQLSAETALNEPTDLYLLTYESPDYGMRVCGVYATEALAQSMVMRFLDQADEYHDPRGFQIEDVQVIGELP